MTIPYDKELEANLLRTGTINYTSTPVKNTSGTPRPDSKLETIPENPTRTRKVARPKIKRKQHPNSSLELGRTPDYLKRMYTASRHQDTPYACSPSYGSPNYTLVQPGRSNDIRLPPHPLVPPPQSHHKPPYTAKGNEDVCESLEGIKQLLEKVLENNFSVKSKVDSLVEKVEGIDTKVNKVDEVVQQAVENAVKTKFVSLENKVEGKIGVIQEKVTNLEKKVTEDINNMKQNIINEVTPALKTELYATLNEHERKRKEEEERKCKLVCYDLDEQKSANPETRKRDDTNEILSFTPHLVTANMIQVKSTHRLGDKPGDGKRPLKIIFGSHEQRERYYAEAKKSEEVIRRGIKFAPDRSKEDREKFRDLKKQLEELKKAGITDMYIKDLELVKKPFRRNPRQGGKQD